MRLKNLLNKYFRLSPFHPQWLALRKEPLEFARANCTQDKQRLLDIGSGRGGLKPLLSEAVEYVGFDYPSTGIDRYQGSPDVLGTAEALPFAPNCFDSLVCLEVMEHLPDPQGALEEMYRVLRPSGKVLISIPFAYPIHDAPYDFQRLTRYQLVRICERAGFVVASISETAHPIETSGMLMNLAIARSVIDGFKRPGPVLLLLPLLVLMVPVLNILAWMFSQLAKGCGNNFLPLGYQLVLNKSPS